MTPVPTGVVEWERESARQLLDDAAQLAKSVADGSLPISTAIQAAAAVPTLVEASQRADLVVVGRSGNGAVSRALLGSVSTGVLHHGHCPVVVVHAEDDEPIDANDRSPVLVGVDGSPPSAHALEIACQEASLRGVDLVAQHSWWGPGAWEFPNPDFEDLRSDLDRWLAGQLAEPQRRYPGITMRRSIVRDQPARRLVESPEHPQLIVVGSHGNGGFAGMLLGSVSRAVVQSARVPVIVAPRR